MNCAWLKSTVKLTVEGFDPTVQTKLLQTIDILSYKLIVFNRQSSVFSQIHK